jgi:hypothetical protein
MASQMTGMKDVWTAIQFDLAVQAFGLYIENKSLEHDKSGNKLYELKDLLAPRKRLSTSQKVEALSSIRGAMGVTTGIRIRGSSI